MTATIFEIKRFAVHDGDGIRTTVFFKGCPLRCLWCHNPEGLSPTPEDALYRHKCISCGACSREDFTPDACLGDARKHYGDTVTVEQLLPLLLEDRAFYETSGGGVTLSGGECLCQADFCAALLKALKDEGIHTAVDTCGHVSHEALDAVIPYTDVFLYDLKACDKESHVRCTGVSNELILQNLKHLDEMGKAIEIRVPYVPECNADQIEGIAHLLAPLRQIVRVHLLAYHSLAASKYEALGIPHQMPQRIPTGEELQAAADTVRRITGFPVLP